MKNLKELIKEKGFIKILEAHDGLTGLIVENINSNGESFHGMWLGSLSDSTKKGLPDNESVSFESRVNTIKEIVNITTKPLLFDGDTGGEIESLGLKVKKLMEIGASGIVLEDKKGEKVNSLFGMEKKQIQCSPEEFSEKIMECKAYAKDSFMVVARIESFILEKGLEDAIYRAKKYVQAGADGILIHSKINTPLEINSFATEFRKFNKKTPLIVVPSTYSSVSEDELKKVGINVVIYANQLLRSSYLSMKKTAKSILEYNRAYESEKDMVSIKEIINLIHN